MKDLWFRKCETEAEKESIKQRLLTNNDLFDKLRASLEEDMTNNLKTLENRDSVAWNKEVYDLSLHLAAERKIIRKYLDILKF